MPEFACFLAQSDKIGRYGGIACDIAKGVHHNSSAAGREGNGDWQWGRTRRGELAGGAAIRSRELAG